MSQYLVNKIIEKEKSEKTGKLDLGKCGLLKLPEKLGELVWIEELIISNKIWLNNRSRWKESKNLGKENKIESLSSCITKLTNLKKLYLSGDVNSIWFIHDIYLISNLKNLILLDISYNKISNFSFLSKLIKLRQLSLRFNDINKIGFLIKLPQLRYLDLTFNQIDNAKVISKLSNLRELYLFSNEITNINFLPKNNKLLKLDLGANKIEDINALNVLSHLKYLNLRSNKISILSSLKDLCNLQTLILEANKIREINFLSELTGLRTLDLRNNAITDIIPLRKLIIDSNLKVSLKDIKYGILIKDNSLTTPPSEIIIKGKETLTEYITDIERSRSILFESKLLIVGEAGAGKTTLARKLKDIDANLPKENESTQGIDIQCYDFSLKRKENYSFRVNIWDFAGQEIYHATHQFFLSKRSLYILLVDNRKEYTNFNYWLQIIELLSTNSPIIIVQNEKGGRKLEFDTWSISKRFNILRVKSLDLKNEMSKVKKLKEYINSEIQKLDHIGQVLPTNWLLVRKQLDIIKIKKPFIFKGEYLKICQQNGINKEKALILSGYLHDLGVFLHFQEDSKLKSVIILNNDWLTNAVYKILEDKKVNSNKGKFSNKDLLRLLYEPQYIKMHSIVLQLMIKFELCYKLEDFFNEEYISPQLLPYNPKKYNWDKNENLIIRYKYEFMPKGLLSKFIVRMHKHIDSQDGVWRYGVLLSSGDSIAEVTEYYYDNLKYIQVRVAGKKDVKPFLSLILSTIDILNNNLKCDMLLPCNCVVCSNNEIPHFFVYSDLLRRKNKNKKKIECNISLKDVNVIHLLDNIFNPSSNVKPTKIFISYAQEDIYFKENLNKHLIELINSNQIIVWDDTKLHAGKWNQQIEKQIRQADIFLPLVSSTYISNMRNYIWKKEIPIAYNRLESNECKIIPIILEPCNWKRTKLSKLTALPEKAKPITDWDNQELGFLSIVTKLIDFMD